jgi:hypothetical protein
MRGRKIRAFISCSHRHRSRNDMGIAEGTASGEFKGGLT